MMNGANSKHREGERGAALIVTILVMVILTLLGISFLMLGETENQIAQNEIRSAQALYAGETGARMVKRFFDRPFSNTNVRNPPLAAIDRTLRMLDEDGDPATAALLQNGGARPMYKQGVDLDANGTDDLFGKPYRGSLAHALLGTEDGPDMRIDEGTTAGANYLAAVSNDLFGAFPGGPGGVQARVTRIDIYSPPYVNVAGTWTRYGMATVKVIARVVQTIGGTEQVLSERMIKAVLNEMPYPGPFGPLHSCANLEFTGDLTVNWGAASAVGTADLTNNHDKIRASWPRELPPGERVDALWTADWANYMAAVDGEVIEDPWFRFLSKDFIDPADLAGAVDVLAQQPFPFTWTNPNPVGDGEWPSHDNNPDDGSHSNVFQNMPVVTCPSFEYDLWKTIATSGDNDVHYYVWDNGTSFKEDGIGAAQTFRAITDNEEGLFFFDTVDGVAPTDTDGDGEFDNLTPEIRITGGTWGSRGFLYLNATEFQTKGVTGRAATFNAPGEPWSDTDTDGVYDVGEPYINLNYSTLAALSDDFIIDTTDAYGGGVMRNDKGPDVAGTAALWGILFNNGRFSPTGNATYYGSVVAKSGVGDTAPAAGTPQMYWDESIIKDWPPSTWELPRVMITRWETDL